jgi:DNA-binding GntR family transcriptional regulator
MTYEQLADLDSTSDQPDDPPPLYQEITMALMNRISGGQIKPYALLPSSATLGTEFGVSAATARRGLRLLARLGWARRAPGHPYQALLPDKT